MLLQVDCAGGADTYATHERVHNLAIIYIFLKSGKKTTNNLQLTKRKGAEVVLFVGKIN